MDLDKEEEVIEEDLEMDLEVEVWEIRNLKYKELFSKHKCVLIS